MSDHLLRSKQNADSCSIKIESENAFCENNYLSLLANICLQSCSKLTLVRFFFSHSPWSCSSHQSFWFDYSFFFFFWFFADSLKSVESTYSALEVCVWLSVKTDKMIVLHWLFQTAQMNSIRRSFASFNQKTRVKELFHTNLSSG